MFGNGRRGGQGGDRGRGRGRGNGNGRGRGRGRGDYASGARNGDKEHAREAAPTRVEETEEQSQARKTYGSWKRLLHEPVNNLATMRRFWKGAFDILETGDRDRCQQLPRDLNSEDETGHRHILALLNTKVNASDYKTFISNARYFLLTITHPSLLRCLAVDTHVGLIYNLFSGVGGKSAVAFLQRLIQALSVARTARMTWLPTEEFSTTLLAASVAVLELLRREPRARFNDEISTLVDSIQAAIDTTQGDDSSSTPVRIHNRLSEIRALLARAQSLVADKNLDDVTPADDEGNSYSYPRDLIVPSDRFDNDKRDIVDIVLFPTRDEIMSDAKEFLPYTDPDQPHFLDDPVQRHIDTFFRLLRHDIFGELKGALAGIMHAIIQTPEALNPKLHLGDVRANSYVNARVSYVTLDNRKGLQAQIEFLQPSEVRKKKETNKEKWWTDSRRFDEGTLLSFIWIDGAAVQHIFLTVSHKTTDPKQEYGLTNNNEMAYITTSLVTQDRMTVKSLMGANTGATCGLLLEFPRIMPATFAPVLECLQGMQRLSRLPFKQWIVPPRHDGPAGARKMHQIPPPLYARPPGFRFSLSPIMKEEERNVPLLIDSTHSCDDEVLIAKVENKTLLDRGQCRALVAALTREYAFIQGPPGTGKSYVGLQIMKVLLALDKRVKLGPILIVCYTNHALDQFLEHLLDVGVKKLIRMGGMSKSKKLEDHNLRGVSSLESNTKAERYMAALNYKELEKKQKDAKSLFAALHGLRKNPDWQHLKDYIGEEHPRIHSQFPIIDDEGFELYGRHPFDIWIASSEFPRTRITDRMIQQIIQKANQSVHFLSPQERGALIAHWIQEAQSNRIGELYEIVDEVAKTQRQLNNIHEEVNRRVLEEAQVIGVTTSGLAKRISVLQQVRCKVIICEEAGEVMESHMICALLPDAEHVIQIGDHEQLRPSVNNFRDLSLESERGKLHQLDRSQFERLSVGEPGRPLMPVAQLNIQRRMRPQISSLIRETIYSKLEDHPSTTNLPDVVGMRHNVFWLDHTNFEAESDANAHITKSKSNMWEVGMVHALVRHIVRQGIYKPDDIAVLTPYTGQLQKLRATMRSDFEICLSDRDKEALENDGFEVDDEIPQAREAPAQQGKPLEKKQLSELLRIATVDNFQGEEAKIIIVSLVRSNDKQKVGFLRTTNRINVLLSRAQHGMYLIGNTQTYTSVEMWQKVIDMLKAAGCVGKSLALSCPRHPAIPIQVHEPEDFHKYSPEGGCMEACTDRLDCGHRCGARCHSKTMHAVFRCEQPCQRQHQPCGHSCQKTTCGEPCGKCMVLLDNVQLPCGHFKHSVACHRTQNLATISCDVKVTKRVPGCEHDVVVKCSLSVSNESYKCPTPCATALPCGHPCPGTCGHCNTKDGQGQIMVKHAICSKICGRKHGTCSHNCNRRCHDGTDCGLCQSPCEVRCKHTKCPQKCHEPCAPCTERCVWSCEHRGDCEMPCSAPCNRLPCDERCTKLLPCGHQCPSICGEDCPTNYCQQCGMKSEELPDMIMMSRYVDVDLNESPIVVLSCGHFFTTETLDGLVGLKDVYKFDEKTGRFIGLIDNAELSATIPKCPNCREPIKQYVTQRYNRLINRAVIDEMSKRFIVNGQQELQSLEERLGVVRDDLEKSRKDIVPASPIIIRREVAHELTMQRINDKIKKRYGETINLMKAVKSFRRRVHVQHQPAYKLHQATIHSVANSPSLDAKFAKLALGSSSKTLERDRDQRVTLGSVLLEIKVQCLLLEDNLEITRAISFLKLNTETLPAFSGGSPMSKTEQFLKDCKKLIKDCKSECLPKLAVEATLYYARIAQLFGESRAFKDTDRTKAIDYRKTAKGLLAEAEKLCKNSFRGRDTLLQAIVNAATMLSKDLYEEVSKEELEAIKGAMVSGPGGIATHSGHWYNCVNGHPFAIGECGMPMEMSLCPECGEPVGGQHHTAVSGVSRASEMEG